MRVPFRAPAPHFSFHLRLHSWSVCTPGAARPCDRPVDGYRHRLSLARPAAGRGLTEVSWRLTFFINVPIAIAAVVLIALARVDGSVKRGERLDPIGAITLVLGLGAVVVALQQSSAWGWGSPVTYAVLALGIALLTVFVLVELRMRDPLLDVRLLTRPAFATDCGVLFAIQAALVVLTVFGAIYVQNVLDLSPAEAGLSLLPITIPFLIVSPLGGSLYDRFGPRWLALSGTTLAAIGLAASGALLPCRERLRRGRLSRGGA